MTFGQAIINARKAKLMSQKQLASLIIKDDGKPISPQYLNDIERDRRNPPNDQFISQFSKVLDIPEEYLFFIVHEIPPKYRQNGTANPLVVQEAFAAFERSYRRGEGGREK